MTLPNHPTTPLIDAARDGNTVVVRSLIDQGASLDTVGPESGTALCWGARNGHADIVDMLLVAGANRHIGGGPGMWAYASPAGKQWDVLAVTRADPAVAEVWRSGGLPVERRDNYTMTDLVIKEQASVFVTGVRIPGPLSPADMASLGYPLSDPTVSAAVEPLRTGPDIAEYTGFSPAISSRFDTGQHFALFYGVNVAARSTGAEKGIESAELPSFRCASVFIKGPFTQLGFAHYSLRHWIETGGLVDAGVRLREVYHYVEAPESDANIVELLIEIA